MADPYVGEIRAFGFNFNPADWALCNGQLLGVSQYTALYSVIGNLYGGTPNQNFALPNLQGQAPIHNGAQGGLSVSVGQAMGTETVTLTAAQMANHAHTFTMASGTYPQLSGGGQAAPGPTVLPSRPIIETKVSGTQIYNYLAYDVTANAVMASAALSPAYGNGTSPVVPHENRMPLLGMNFCICVNGYYPVRPQ